MATWSACRESVETQVNWRFDAVRTPARHGPLSGAAGMTHVYFPRSKRRESDRRMPLILRCDVAIEHLGARCLKFRDGDIPGPLTMWAPALRPGWADARFWSQPAAAASRVSSKPVRATLTTARQRRVMRKVLGKTVRSMLLVQERRSAFRSDGAVPLPPEEVADDGGLNRGAIFAPKRLHHVLGQKEQCAVCRDSVAQRKQSRRRHSIEPFESFGDLITMEHVNANSMIQNGLPREKELLVVPDLATGYLWVYAVGSKIAGRVTQQASRVAD